MIGKPSHENKYYTKNIKYVVKKHRFKTMLYHFAPHDLRNKILFLLKLALRVFVTMLIVYTLVFLLVNSIPGDNQIIAAAKEKGDPATIKRLEDLFYLNDSWISRYFKTLGHMFDGTYGLSGSTGRYVSESLFPRFSLSIQIGSIALALSLLIGLPIGIYSARRKDPFNEVFIAILSSISFSVPPFVFGLFFMIINYSMGLPIVFEYGNAFMYFIPAIVIAIPIAFTYARYLKTSMREEYQKQYVSFARVKGLDEETILWKQVFKTSLYPIITYFPLVVITCFFGSMTIETIFGIPGSGTLLVSSALENDHNMVLALAMVYTILVVLSFAIRDLLYTLIDPKIMTDI